jgi:putative transposase
MPRPLRIIEKNNWYHIMNRGQSRKYIFLNPYLCEYFLELLGVIKEKYDIEIHCFCLMGNHYHLLVRTQKENLSQAIGYLNAGFAREFNKIRKRDGSLFKGRFKSLVIKNERYLFNVSRYIHLNPVEAGLAEKPYSFEWSSCSDYLHPLSRYTWLNRDYIQKFDIDYSAYLKKGIPQKIKDIYNKERLVSILN